MKVYEPLGGVKEWHATTGVVLFNTFGSLESQDTGRDAQSLANARGVVVLATNRPGTEVLLPSRKLKARISSPMGYLAEMAFFGKSIDRTAERLGLKKIVAAGRSAGGLGALALARSETVSSLRAVFAAEPVAVEEMDVAAGIHKYREYFKHQEALLEGSMEIIKPLTKKLPLAIRLLRAPGQLRAKVVDRYHNKELFASSAAASYAEYIASDQPQIDTTLEFAEHSLVISDEAYAEQIKPLETLRSGGEPFKVRVAERTVHSSFDNGAYFNSRIQPTLDRIMYSGN